MEKNENTQTQQYLDDLFNSLDLRKSFIVPENVGELVEHALEHPPTRGQEPIKHKIKACNNGVINEPGSQHLELKYLINPNAEYTRPFWFPISESGLHPMNQKYAIRYVDDLFNNETVLEELKKYDHAVLGTIIRYLEEPLPRELRKRRVLFKYNSPVLTARMPVLIVPDDAPSEVIKEWHRKHLETLSTHEKAKIFPYHKDESLGDFNNTLDVWAKV
jgi:hypothetical protein